MTRNDKTPESPQPGRYAYAGLDRALHEKARLGILAALMSQPEGLLFNEIKECCALTDGNLSRHLQILHKENLVDIWKGYRKNRPQTLCRLSAGGRKRFMSYLQELEKVIADAARGSVVAEKQGTHKSATFPADWIPA